MSLKSNMKWKHIFIQATCNTFSFYQITIMMIYNSTDISFYSSFVTVLVPVRGNAIADQHSGQNQQISLYFNYNQETVCCHHLHTINYWTSGY